MIRIVINGEARHVADGISILRALDEARVHVPQLCHDARVTPAGACRLCLVEIRGQPKPVPACATVATDGMVIDTHTPHLEAGRREILEMMAWRHPPEARERSNPFIAELVARGLAEELAGAPDSALVDDSHPYIHVDMARCIDCYRCVRICDELQGQSTWRIADRGGALRVIPDGGGSLRASSCVGCGACADTCPTGAIIDRSILAGEPTRWTRTTCPYCGVGCEMQVGTREGKIAQVKPVRDAHVSKGHLCVKGRYAFGFVDAPDRITAPMIREGNGWRTVSWDEALGFIAGRFAQLRAAHGPDSIGVLGSARATNEDNYLTQKLARVVLGTNNVDCCARVCHAPSAAGLSAMLGTGAATNSFDDIERARTLLVVGANATEAHPIVGARIRQAALHGAKLIVIDPRRTELAAIADLHLQLRAGTNVPLLNAIANVIISEELVDRTFVSERVDGLEGFRTFVAGWTPERAAAACGVEPESIRRAARMYATERPAMAFHGLGLTEHVQGTDGVMCLVNLALLTGNLGCPGSGVNPLRGQNNVQGAAHMGCEPHHLTGYVTLDAGRGSFERVWASPIPQARGLDWMEMIDAAGDGRLKALYAIGYDVLLTNPDHARTRAALGKLELVIVQDLFLTETAAELAHVVLPAAASFEKDGTFMNAERRVQRVRRAVEPPGQARSDADIVCALAAVMGHRDGFSFGSAEEIWDEVRAVWPAGAGITYPRLERGGLQWPCPSEDHPGTPLLHATCFANGGKAALRSIEYQPGRELSTDELPLVLVTGRRLFQFNAGTMTDRTPNASLQPTDVLGVCPEDAASHGLAAGDQVVVRSRHGEATITVEIDRRVRPGEVFATFHTSDVLLNRVTGDGRDAITHTPEYKVTAVRIDKLANCTDEAADEPATPR
jgi:formate dehydrogenase major subunit